MVAPAKIVSLVEDLKKKRASNQSFWLVGRPDVDLRRIKSLMRRPVVVDGRNLYNPDTMRTLGFVYRGIGR